jgi:hypothetical protein
VIYFGDITGSPGLATAMPHTAPEAPGAQGAHEAPAAHPAHEAPAPPPSQPPSAPVAPVARAEGAQGRTIVEVYTQRGELKDKVVAIRGRVVKYNAGIMGKNWLHLRDGTGSSITENHDITVTTLQEAAVGQVVLARGVLRSEVDLGSGYKFHVMVEQASLEK